MFLPECDTPVSDQRKIMGKIVSTCVFELGTVSKRQSGSSMSAAAAAASAARHSVCPRLARNKARLLTNCSIHLRACVENRVICKKLVSVGVTCD